MRFDSVDQQPDILDTSEQTQFSDFLEKIKEEQKNIDIRLFEKYFSYKAPDKLTQVLYYSKSEVDDYNKASLIYDIIDRLGNKAKKMPTDTK